jgi:DeoR family fructose operon transcriptional repressor
MYNQRQQHMMEHIKTHGEVRIADLKERYAVTEMTIRRDLEKFEHQGVLRRTFGGAILVSQDIELRDRSGIFLEEKRAIGKKAASYVQSGEVIFIDAGTTTFQVARHLPNDLSITVVTNALNVATELIDRRIPSMMIGGNVMEATSATVGPLAIEAMLKMAFDRVFLGTSGISALQGFSNSNIYEAELKRIAIRRSTEVNIVADHSKYGVKSLVSFADFQPVHRLICNQMPELELQPVLIDADVELVIVS